MTHGDEEHEDSWEMKGSGCREHPHSRLQGAVWTWFIGTLYFPADGQRKPNEKPGFYDSLCQALVTRALW